MEFQACMDRGMVFTGLFITSFWSPFFFSLAFDASFHNWLIESQLFLYDITRGLIWST